MKNLLIIFLVLFPLTGISLFQIESVIITPFHIFSVLIITITLIQQKSILPSNIKFAFILLLLLLLTFFININLAQSYNTLLHSIFYILIYCIILLNLKRITLEMFIKINKFIIVIYFLGVLIAKIAVTLNINGYFLNQYFGILFETKLSEYRFYGFSSEPSYMAIIISFCMFSLFIINKRFSVPQISLFFSLYVILIFLSKSGYGLIFLILILYYNYGKYFRQKKVIITSVILSLIYITFLNYKLEGRFMKIIEVAFSITSLENKLELWNIVDSSSYYRIGPTFWLFDNLDFTSLNTLFGHGMGTDRAFFYKFGVGYEGNYLNLGFIPVFIYTNGLIAFSYFLLYMYRILKKLDSALLMFAFFIILFNCGLATQLFWFIISLMTILSSIYTEIITTENEKLNSAAIMS